ncbi:MAG TPA: GspE/PulE family protein [Phycisphaeraceae bacterium]
MPFSAVSPMSSDPAATPQAARVGDLLVEKGLLTPEQLEQALAHQRTCGHQKLLGEVLVELKLATPEQVMEALAQAYGVPFARISPRVADPKVVELLPRDFLQKQGVLPLFVVEGRLTLAVHEPANVFLVEEVQRLTGLSVQVVAATAKDIQATLQAHLPNANVFVIDDLVEGFKEEELALVHKPVADLSDLESTAGESPVIRLVNYLIYSAVQEGASDIHIEPADQACRVRFRVDGQLYEKMSPPHTMLPAIASRIKIMAGMDISERRLPQDGGICVMISQRQIDLRVSTMPGKLGEKVVIRIIDKRNAATGLDKLGMGFDLLESYRALARRPNGIILVTGPTGSGKSTTLYATLHEINDPAVNISTVEDPVEYNLPGVNQFQVNEKAGFTFAAALRALLRQVPDVIMVGEVRDQETARIAIQSALTGHLVFSTMHTNDAPSAVTRLINIGVEPYLIAASLQGVLAQRLVRKICTACKEPQEITPPMARALERLAPGGPPVQTLYHGAGCAKCRHTGYAGRIGIYELFIPDDETLDAISRGAGLQELRRLAGATGRYRTLRDDGLEKVRAGLTTLQELFTATAA